MRLLRSKLAMPAVLLASLLCAAGRAQGAEGFALPRFEPAARGGSWFALDSLELRGHLEPSVGLLIDWGYKPLVIYNLDGSERAALVEHQAIAHLGAGMVFWDRLRLSFDLPYAAWQKGTDSTIGTTVYRAPDASALGDVRLAADVRLTGDASDGLGLAVGLTAQIPSGSASSYLGDGAVHLVPRLQLAGAHGLLAYAAQLGFAYSNSPVDFAGARLGTGMRMGLAVGLRALDGKLTVGPELHAGSDLTRAQQLFEKRTTPFEGLLGLHYKLGGGFRLGAGAGGGFSRALGTPKLRGVFSLDWAPEPAARQPVRADPDDADGDRIPDGADACPDLAGVSNSDLSLHGCPAQADDRDGDAIPDDVDACRDVPGLRNKDPKKHGCPPPDRDGDRIPDATDACPDLAGVVDSDLSKHGCPPPPPDKDQDGVADGDDACPEAPGPRAAEPKRNGCPPDRDGDAVADAADACPDAPVGPTPDPTRTGCPLRDEDGDAVADSLDNCPLDKGPASNQGCPKSVKQLVIITREKLKITDKVYFATNKATILTKSNKLLEQVAKVLAQHPEIGAVVVEGHTDDRGAAQRNRDLSQARAESVRQFLVRKGVPAGRLQAKGFGPDRPAQTNKSARGREANRRVEFTILSGEQAPAAPAKAVEPPPPPAEAKARGEETSPDPRPAAAKAGKASSKLKAAKPGRDRPPKKQKAKRGKKGKARGDDLDTSGLMDLISPTKQ